MGFFGSVLFNRILVAIVLVSIAGVIGFTIAGIVSKSKNKKAAKQTSTTKVEKEIKTEKEQEAEQELTEEKQNEIEEEVANITEFEHNGVKYVKYKYGASECVCKPENSSKWITFAQKLQNTKRLENSKEIVNSTLIVSSADEFECFITGEKEELTSISKNDLTKYNTQIKEINKEVSKPEEVSESEETKEVGV